MIQEKQKECSWNTSSKGNSAYSLESLLGSSICIPRDNFFLEPVFMMQDLNQKLMGYFEKKVKKAA